MDKIKKRIQDAQDKAIDALKGGLEGDAEKIANLARINAGLCLLKLEAGHDPEAVYLEFLGVDHV